ncbi:MAG: DAK2 domain-containing protein [Chloroflexi bacterium]|nr:DAK2 domain-containing protein [Chloroflexota bacterium]
MVAPTEQDSRRRLKRIDGQGLKQAIAGATAWLERQAAAINALNVFPVPDGDTGTNMTLTMRATVAAVAASPEHHLGKMAAAMAHGALLGARGNSGVILSQIIRGFAKAVEQEAELDGAGLARALAGASKTAYAGIAQPVEGTMLTVIRRAAEVAGAAAAAGRDLEQVLVAATEEARRAVAETPTQLTVLRQAGVVDAGGQGLYVLLDGMLRTLRGQLPAEAAPSEPVAVSAFSGEQTYGYCTQYLIQGNKLDPAAVQRELAALGDSLLVVGDDTLVRVHLHTFDPGAALQVGTRLGILRNVSVENMQLQHEVWREERQRVVPTSGVSVVAVAAGEGFQELFRTLGVAEIVPGGQTMNPSAEELVAAIERAPTSEVILLPNNTNILLAAQQAQKLTSRTVEIVPTRSLAEGVAAVLALRYDANFATTVEAMRAAAAAVTTGEITVAVRDATFDGFTIRQGQAMGLLDGQVVAVGDSVEEVFWLLLPKLRVEQASLLTLYPGEGVELAEAQALAERVRERYPNLQVEVVPGGQPLYPYILGCE